MRPGKTRNIDDEILESMDRGDFDQSTIDDIIREEKAKAPYGARYLQFQHPSAVGGGEFTAMVSLYPHQDLKHRSSRKQGLRRRWSRSENVEKIANLRGQVERTQVVLRMGLVPKHQAAQLIRKASRIMDELSRVEKMVPYQQAKPYLDEDEDDYIGGRAGASDGYMREDIEDTFDPSADSTPSGPEAGGMSQDASEQRRRRKERIKLGTIGDLGTPGSQMRVVGRRRVCECG